MYLFTNWPHFRSTIQYITKWLWRTSCLIKKFRYSKHQSSLLNPLNCYRKSITINASIYFYNLEGICLFYIPVTFKLTAVGKSSDATRMIDWPSSIYMAIKSKRHQATLVEFPTKLTKNIASKLGKLLDYLLKFQRNGLRCY